MKCLRRSSMFCGGHTGKGSKNSFRRACSAHDLQICTIGVWPPGSPLMFCDVHGGIG
jgi:hypothetical protein